MKILLLFLSLLAIQSKAQDLTSAANAFLNLLNAEQKINVQYSLNDKERFNWNFVPTQRNGACFRTFTPQQRTAALALLKVSLSEQGYKKANSIMELENMVAQLQTKFAPVSGNQIAASYTCTVTTNTTGMTYVGEAATRGEAMQAAQEQCAALEEVSSVCGDRVVRISCEQK